MANSNITRETQKNRLKRQLVPAGDDFVPERKPLPKAFLPALLLVLFLCAIGGYLYFTNRHYDSLTVIWDRSTQSESGKAETFRGYEPFAKGVLQYSKDGASYVDGDGKTIWERSYQMQNPIVAVQGDYAVIADRGAQSIYIFNASANTGLASTVLPVSRVAVSGNGVVYAVLKDESADYITAFKADGSGIDLSVKSIITGDGYPIDIAVSPDGTELITSYVSIENSQTIPKVIFRNFDEVGQAADARRVVGGFTDEFAGHLVGKVNFSSNEYSQAFYDGGIAFFSTKVLTSPELLANVTFEEEINSIAYSKDYAAVVLNTNTGEMPYKLVVFKANGAKLSETEFNFPYTSFEINGDYILLYNETACRVYNTRGHELLAADLPAQTSFMVKTGFMGEFLIGGSGQMMKVKMN